MEVDEPTRKCGNSDKQDTVMEKSSQNDNENIPERPENTENEPEVVSSK